MALNLQLAEAYVQITARNEQFRQVLAQTQRETEHAVKNIQDNFGRVKSLGRELTVPFLALIAAGGGVVKVASDVESAFLGVAKVLDGLADRTGKMTDEGREMREEFLKLARAVPVPVEELMRFGAIGGQLGIAKDAVVKFSETMARLKVSVEGVSMENLALQMARITSVMKIPQNDIDRLGSVIVELGNRFAAMEGEITDAATDMLGFAKLAKLSASELLGFAAGAKAVGAESAAVSTALQRIVITMRELMSEAGDAEQLEKLATVAGMTGEQFKKAFAEDSANAILAFLDGLRRIEAAGGDAIVALDELGLADARLIRETLKLAGGVDVVRDAVKKANEEWGRNTALVEESERRFGSFNSTAGRLRNALRELIMVLGEPVMERAARVFSDLTANINATIPRVRTLLESLGPMFNNLKNVLSVFVGGRENLDALLATIGKVSAAFAATVAAMYAVGTALSVISKLFAFAGANISLLIALLGGLLSPLTLIPAALAVLYTAWVKNWGGIQDFTENITIKLGEFFTGLSAHIENIAKTASPFLRGAWEGMKWSASIVIDFASSAAQSAWEFLQREWESLRRQGIQLYVNEKVQDTLGFLRWLGEQPISVRVSAMLDDALAWLRAASGKTIDTITISVRWAGERISEFLQSLGENEIVVSVRDAASAALERIVSWWRELADNPRRVLEVIVESGEKAIETFTTVGKLTIDFAGDAARSAFEWLQAHWAALSERGISISVTLVEGVKEWFTQIRQSEITIQIKATFDEAIAWIRQALGKTVGAITVTIQGLTEGFAQLRESQIVVSAKAQLDEGLQWLRSVSGKTLEAITITVQGIPEWLGRVRESQLVITVQDAASQALARIKALWNEFAADPRRVLEIGLEAGEDLLDMLQQGFASIGEHTKGAFENLRKIDLEPVQRVWESIANGAQAAAKSLASFFSGIDQAITRGVEFEKRVLASWATSIKNGLDAITDAIHSSDFINSFVQGFSDIARRAAAAFTGIFKGALIGAEFLAGLAGDIARFIADNAKELSKVIIIWREEMVKALQDETIAKEIVGLGKSIAGALFEGLRAAGGLFNVFVELVHLEIQGFVTLGQQIGKELWSGLSGFLSQQDIFKSLNLNFAFGIQMQDKTETDQASKAVTDAIVKTLTGAVAAAALKPLLERVIPGSTWIERIAAIGIPVAFGINFVFGGEKGGWEDALLITGLVAANIVPVLVRKVQDALKGQAGLLAMRAGGVATIGVGIAAGIVFNFMNAEVGEAEGMAEKVKRAISAAIPAALAGVLSLVFTRNAWVATITAGLVLQFMWDKLVAPEAMPEEWKAILLPLQDLSVQVFPALSATATKLAEALSAIFTLLRDVGAFNIFSAAIKIVGEALGGVAGLLQSITGLLTGDWAMAWEGAKKVLDGILGILKTTAEVLGGVALRIAEIVTSLIGMRNIMEKPISKGFFASLFEQLQKELSKLQPEIRAKLTLDTSALDRILGTKEIPGLRDYFRDLATTFPKLFAGMQLAPEQQKTVETISRMIASLSQGLEAFSSDQKLTADELRSLISVAAQIEQNLSALPPDLQRIVRENATLASLWQSIAQSLEDIARKFSIPIERKASGGIVPGIGRGDKVPALLEPGEYVVPRSVIDRQPGIIAALEAARLGRRRLTGFKRGGLVRTALVDTQHEAGEGVLDLLQSNIWQGVPEIMRGALADVVDVMTGLMKSFYATILQAFPNLGPAQQQLLDSLQQMTEKMQQIGRDAVDPMSSQEIRDKKPELPPAKQPDDPFPATATIIGKQLDPFKHFISGLEKRMASAFDADALKGLRSEILEWAEKAADRPEKLFLLGEGMEGIAQRARELQGAFGSLGLNVSALEEIMEQITLPAFQKSIKEALSKSPLEAADTLKVLGEGIKDNVEQMGIWQSAFRELISSIETRIAFFEGLGKTDMAKEWQNTLRQVRDVFKGALSDPLAVLQEAIADLDFSNALAAGEELYDLMQQNISLVLQDVRAGEMLVGAKRDLIRQVENMLSVYGELGLPTKELETTLDHLNMLFGGVADALGPLRAELSKLSELTPLDAVMLIRSLAKSVAGQTLPKGMQAGGLVSGTGVGDKIPALLEPGEFVVRRAVAQKNLPELLSLNAVGFKEGGLVGQTTSWAEYWKDWASRLNKSEVDALYHYASFGYQHINKFLRGTLKESDAPDTVLYAKRAIEDLDTAIAKGELPKGRTAWRGFGSRSLGAIAQRVGVEGLEGLIVKDPAFMSTSLLRETAYSFFEGALERSQLFGKKYNYPPVAFLAGMELPASARAAYPNVLLESYISSLESELVLPRGSIFEITKAKFRADDSLIELMMKPLRELPTKAPTLLSALLPTPIDLAQLQAEEGAAWLIRSGRLPADYAPSALSLSEMGDLLYDNKVILRPNETIPFSPSLWDITIRPLLEMLGFERTRMEQAVLDQLSESTLQDAERLLDELQQRGSGFAGRFKPQSGEGALLPTPFQKGGPVGIAQDEIARIAKLLQDKRFDLPMSTSILEEAVKEGRFYALFMQAQQEKMQKAIALSLAGKPAADKLLREQLFKSLSVGIISANRGVRASEEEVLKFLQRGEWPSYMATGRVKGLESAAKYVSELDTKSFAKMSMAERIKDIADNVLGLAHVKSAFSLAVSGIENIGTLDIWMSRAALGKATIPSFSSVDDYIDTLQKTFGNVNQSGIRQWNAFFELGRGAAPLFDDSSMEEVYNFIAKVLRERYVMESGMEIDKAPPLGEFLKKVRSRAQSLGTFSQYGHAAFFQALNLTPDDLLQAMNLPADSYRKIESLLLDPMYNIKALPVEERIKNLSRLPEAAIAGLGKIDTKMTKGIFERFIVPFDVGEQLSTLAYRIMMPEGLPDIAEIISRYLPGATIYEDMAGKFSGMVEFIGDSSYAEKMKDLSVDISKALRSPVELVTENIATGHVFTRPISEALSEAGEQLLDTLATPSRLKLYTERLVFAHDETLPDPYAGSPFTMVRLLESGIRPFLEMLGLVRNRIEEAVIERYGPAVLQSDETLQMLEGIRQMYERWMKSRQGGSMGARFTPGTDGFFAGGFTGLGGVSDPAGVVHKGEYVLPAWMVRRMPTAVAALESVRKRGFVRGGKVGGEVIAIDVAAIADSVTESIDGLNEFLEKVADTMQTMPVQAQASNTQKTAEEALRLLAEEQRKIFNELRQQIQVRKELGLELPEEMLKQFRILSIMLERDLTPAAQETAKKLLELDLKPSVDAIKQLKELGIEAGMNAEQLGLLAEETRRLFSEQQQLASSLRELGLSDRAKEIEDALADMKLALLDGTENLVEMLTRQFSKLDFSRPTEESANIIREAIPKALEQGGEAISIVAGAVSRLVSTAEQRLRELQAIGASSEMIEAARDVLYNIKSAFADEGTRATMATQRELEGIGREATVSAFLANVEAASLQLVGLLQAQGDNIDGLKLVRSAMEDYERRLKEVIALLPEGSEQQRKATSQLRQAQQIWLEALGGAANALDAFRERLSGIKIEGFIGTDAAENISQLLSYLQEALQSGNIEMIRAVAEQKRNIENAFRGLISDFESLGLSTKELRERFLDFNRAFSQKDTGALGVLRNEIERMQIAPIGSDIKLNMGEGQLPAFLDALFEEFAAFASGLPSLISNALSESGMKALAPIREIVTLFESQQKEWLETLEMLGVGTEEFAKKLMELNASLLIDGPKKRLAELQLRIDELLKGDIASKGIIDALKKLALETFGDPSIRQRVLTAMRDVSSRITSEIENYKAVMGVFPDQAVAKERIKALEVFLADFEDTFKGASKTLAERIKQRLDTLLDFDVLSPKEAFQVIMEQFREVMESATEAGERVMDGLQVSGGVSRAGNISGSQAEAIIEIARAKDALITQLESTASALEGLGINADETRKQMLQIEARFAALPEHMISVIEGLDFSQHAESAKKLLDVFVEIPRENKIAQDFIVKAREQVLSSLQKEIDRRKALGLSTYFLEQDLERARAGFADLSPAMKRFTETLRSEVSGFVNGLFGPLAPVINDFVFNTLGGAVVNSLQDFVVGILEGLGGMKAVAQVSGSLTNTVQAIADRLETMGIGLDSITSSFFGLITQSESYKRLMEELRPIIQALADALGFILEPIVDIVRALREFFGITKEVNDAFSVTSANVPVGFKFERLRYAAALPDQPPLRGRGSAGGGIFGPIIEFFKSLTRIPIVGELLKAAFWLGRLALSLIILDKIIRAIPILGGIYDELVKSIAKPIANWVWSTILEPGWNWFVTSVLAPSWNWFVQNVLKTGWDFVATNMVKQMGDALANANWLNLTIAAGTVFLMGALGNMIEQKGKEIAEQGIVAGEPAQIARGRAIQGAGTGIKWGAILGGIAGFLLGGPMGAIVGAGLGGLGGAGIGASTGYITGHLESRQHLAPAPAMQLGGYVSQTGLALVHAGEYVIPQRQMAGVREMSAEWWQAPAMSLQIPEISVPPSSNAVDSGRGNEPIYIGKLVIDDPDINRRLRDYIRMKNLRQRGVGASHTLLD